eukprot:SAG31_NODE_26_length_32985_cov_39.054096_1_plen_1525_part_10
MPTRQQKAATHTRKHGQQQQEQRMPSIVCSPECIHGTCEPARNEKEAAAPAQKPQPEAGVCRCKDGYVGESCGIVRCPKWCAAKGQCIAPDVCSCSAGWSGKKCDVPGTIQYGSSWLKLRSGNRRDEQLFSSRDLRSAVSTAQAVINWQHADPDNLGNWWQVLGPSGTSDAFLHGHAVRAGATIRLRHVATGGLLRGDTAQPALARPDLKEVSCLRTDTDRDSSLSSLTSAADDEEWVAMINGTALDTLEWGLGWPVQLQHKASGHLLACAGQTYQVKNQESLFGKRVAPVYEIQLQPQIEQAASQRWHVAEHKLSEQHGKESVAGPHPVELHTVIRLANIARACYLQVDSDSVANDISTTTSMPLHCGTSGGIASFWIVLGAADESVDKAGMNGAAEREQRIHMQLESFAETKTEELLTMKLWKLLAQAEEALPTMTEEQLEQISKVQLVALLVEKYRSERARILKKQEPVQSQPMTRVYLQHVLTQNLISEHSPAAMDGDVSANSSSCIEVVSKADHKNLRWLTGESVELTFCGSNTSIGQSARASGAFVAEMVSSNLVNESVGNKHDKLAEVCVAHKEYTAAISHYTEALNAIRPSRRERMRKHHRGFSSKHLLLFRRARTHMLLGHPQAAVSDLEVTINEAPKFAEANLYHARIAISLGKWQSANASLHSIIANKKESKLQYKAGLYIAQINQSMQLLEEATEALSVSDEAFGAGAARCAISDADRDVLQVTRRQFTELLEVAPESVTMRLQRAKTNLLLGDVGAAKSDATWAIRLAKHSPQGFLLRGLAHLYSFDHSSALGYFKWCVKVDLDHNECRQAVKAMKLRKLHVENATNAFKSGRFTLALDQYGAAIETMPGHCLHTALMRLQRCRCLIYMNKPMEAKNECSEALRLDPELKDAELLSRDAVSIAADYQTWCEQERKRRENAEKKRKAEEEKRRKAEEERKVEEERERAREEADKRGTEYVDPFPDYNGTNSTEISQRLNRDWDEEGRIKRATICEGHYFRLNMSSYKTRQRRCALVKLRHSRSLCSKLRGCIWHPDVQKHPPQAEQNTGVQEVINETTSWDESDDAWLMSKIEDDSWDDEVRGRCEPKEVTLSDVKRSYRRMAMLWHPDKKSGPMAKLRAEKVFQNIVASYEYMANERQLKVCNSGDTSKHQHHQQQHGQQKQQQNQQHNQSKEEQQQKRPPPTEPPKSKPQAGRSQAEPPKQDPPTYASMDWIVRTSVVGLLPDREWHMPDLKDGAAHTTTIRYSFSMQFTPMTNGRQSGKMINMVDLDAIGHPERLIHWQSAAWAPNAAASAGGGGFEEFRRNFGVKDEFGKHTQGETGSAGWGGGDGRQEKPWFIPAQGSLKLFFNAQRSGNTATYNSLTEDQWAFSLEAREYDFSELVPSSDGSRGVAMLRLMIDDREGPVDIFIGLARLNSAGQASTTLRLDSVTAVFSETYWVKKTSLTRKMGILMEGTLAEAAGSSIHYAIDGDRDTSFMSAGPLLADDALAVDLQMIYHFSKLKLAEGASLQAH